MFNHNGYRAGATGAHARQNRPAAGVWGPADSAGPAVGAGPRRMRRPRNSPAQCTRRNATSRHQTFDIPVVDPCCCAADSVSRPAHSRVERCCRGPRSPDGESSSAMSTRSATSTVTRPPLYIPRRPEQAAGREEPMFNHDGYRVGATAHAERQRPDAGVSGAADSAAPSVGDAFGGANLAPPKTGAFSRQAAQDALERRRGLLVAPLRSALRTRRS